MTADISRLFRDPDKQYHGLVHQQGRIPLDSDENHGADIAQWTDETRFVETIAPSGSPDDGFKISLAGAGVPVDFHVAAGSYYLGGARVENPASIDYRDQRDFNWLGFPLDAEGASEAIGNAKQFLVWLDAREAVVTATEDSELLEPGLGGPDTAARKRFSWHVRATAVAGPGCIPAAVQWLAAMNWTGKVDEDTGLLASGATLTVAFNPADVDQDLCQPSLIPGFLGARNECFRAMVTRAGRYVWGQDDASPLYRVRVENVAGQPRRIVFLDTPRDEFVRPRAGHSVELLRWDHLLPNRQKTAEAMGRFFTVSSGYVDDAIIVSSNVEAAWIAWLAGLPPTLLSDHDDANEKRYFYLRVWTGGGAAGQPDIPFATHDLPGTGLSITFSAGTLPGDAWAIAARPNAPARVMPWALMDGMTAHAPRRHVVPLAFVDLNAMTVTDCRRRFRPLYRIGGCCTVTVGDGVNSWGDVDTIAAAIARLPASGGEICIGPGTYSENIVLEDRNNITFTGCGRRTRWVAANPANPLLEIRDCNGITVRRLRMEGALSQCIFVGMPDGVAQDHHNFNLLFEDLLLQAPSGSAILARRCERLRLRASRIEVGPFPAGPPPVATASMAAVFIQGIDLLVERNTIFASLGPNDLPSQLPLGGLHIGGDSHRIVVLRNEIVGGNGNGITLGSVKIVSIPAASWAADPAAAAENAVGQVGMRSGFFIYIDPAGCIHIGWPDPTENPDGTVDLPVSDGVVSDVRVEKNNIIEMGGSGIATFPMMVMLDTGEAALDAVAVERLLVLDNSIGSCMKIEAPDIPLIQFLFTGFGGIALGMALDCTIRDNQIADIGGEQQAGVCGVFIGYGEDVRIERNRIENVGSGLAGNSAAPAGGVYLRLVVGGISSQGAEEKRTRDRPALFVQNNVVHAPHARALKAVALGPVHVSDNRLTGGNPSLFFNNPLLALIILFFGGRSVQELLTDPSAELDLGDLLALNLILEVLGGDAVNLVNLGMAEEMLLPDWIKDWFKDGGVPGTGIDNATDARRAWSDSSQAVPAYLRGGETLFANNQVSLHAPRDDDNAATVSSVLILTRDDLGFADNQCEVEADLTIAVTDAVLLAATVRASANRMQEAALCLISLLSWGGLNTTADNQTTFLLLAAASNPTKLAEHDNLMVV